MVLNIPLAHDDINAHLLRHLRDFISDLIEILTDIACAEALPEFDGFRHSKIRHQSGKCGRVVRQFHRAGVKRPDENR